MSLLGGIRPPIAVFATLLLALAGVTALGLGSVKHKALPEAVLTSQQHFAEDGAVALRASLDEGVTDLRRVAGMFSAGAPASPDTVLDKVGSTYQKWRGTAVIEIESGKLLAARGENVPFRAIDRTKLGEPDGLAPRMIRLANGETRLMSFALLTWDDKPQQLLVATNSLRFPGISLGKFRAIAVVDSEGTILSSDGIPEPEQVLTDLQRDEVKESNRQLKVFAEQAVKDNNRHPQTTKEPGSGGFLGISGSIVGDTFRGDRSVAGYATLAPPKAGPGTIATGLGLTVVAMVKVMEDPTSSINPLYGLVAAGALLLIGALVVAVLMGTVQRPLLKLFLESRRLARGDLRRPVTVPPYGETARIGQALERLRVQLGGEPADTRPTSRLRRRLGASLLIVLCAALVLSWAAPVALLVNRAGNTVVIPQQLVDDQRERTDTISDRVRRSLNEGHADLTSVGRLIGDETDPKDMRAVLERTAYEHKRYRSLYVLDGKGEVIVQTGHKPRHPGGQAPSEEPIAMLGEGGKEPIVAGYAEIPGRGGAAIVGEFRTDFLNSLLKRPGLGQVRVVDAERRVIGGNNGFLPFKKLPNKQLDALAQGSAQKVGMYPRPSGVQFRDGDDVQLAAAAPFSGGGPAKSLGWSVVSWQKPNGMAIPAYVLQNRTVLAGLLALTAAAACLGWLHIIVAKPLRALTGQAEALADGDRRTVLFPRHHDEVGAVARSLELVRQALQDRQRRDGAQAVPAGRN
ncbi:HAMP domain-containing protein [Streptomyces sp. OF3]|uniref:HAMP domain-containing protein n=2 Tax=Streptomyces alkaliterrae TaxID=2213162 RepID=A0A5P0YRB3_9ACTN|nr:HAMP domain-containing protein [Streptomyces alkaliterrae]MBB1259994.1 HAMP domain-containing protein [Streptomyces alkaliterrae]MQS02856.1 HAMP domain-containing protein [Streptomyces alkaliterrae]